MSYEVQSDIDSIKWDSIDDSYRYSHKEILDDKETICTDQNSHIQEDSGNEDEDCVDRRCGISHARGQQPGGHIILQELTRDEHTHQGIAAYVLDCDEGIQNSSKASTDTPKASQVKRNQKRRKQPQPWYCVSRPISKQTKDIKISSVNKSTSIYYSKLLEKCRSIVEFCIPNEGEKEELSTSNITDMNYNHNWGDALPSNAKGNTIRVVYQNVHHSLSASNNPHTNNLLDNLNNMEADIFMASETNTNWKSAEFRNKFKSKVAKIWPANRIAFSSSDVGFEFELHKFLLGGTCTMAVDNLSMRVVKAGEDESGLGRWSYITLEGQGGRKVTFITAY